MNYFSDNIIFLRKKKGLTQEEFAKSVGISRNMIASYENKVRLPKLDTLIAISNIYNISIDDLLKKKMKL